MKRLLERCKCSVHLEVNVHRSMYQSASDRVKEIREYDEIGDELERRMIETDEIYELQFYPDTPVGSYSIYGTSLDEVLKKALEDIEEHDNAVDKKAG